MDVQNTERRQQSLGAITPASLRRHRLQVGFEQALVQGIPNGWSASCGRQADAAVPLGSESANSTRAGDSSSASWKSVT